MRFQFKTSGSKRLTRSFEHGDVLAPVGWFTIFQDRAMNANTSDKSKNQNGVACANPYMEGKPSNTLKKGTKTLITPAQIVATSPIQRMNSKSLRNEAIVTSEDETYGAMPQRIDLTQFEHDEQKFYRYLEEQNLPNNNWFIGTERPKTAYDFKGHVKEAYGNGALTGIQGDYCCLVTVGDYDAIVTLEWDNDDDVQEYYLCIEEMVPNPTATKRDLITELKRCYDLIDELIDSAPYVEHCEECGATDGGDAQGCHYCGITDYQSKPRGFYHKDSPKR